jgi:hypothetical protein
MELLSRVPNESKRNQARILKALLVRVTGMVVPRYLYLTESKKSRRAFKLPKSKLISLSAMMFASELGPFPS